MRAKILHPVKARNQTNPNLLQLSIIAQRREWKALIEYLEKETDIEAIEDFFHILKDVVISGEKESDSREYVAADE